MSEVDSQSPVIDAATLEDATSVSLDTSSQANSETHAEHEDVDVTELDGSAPQEDTPTDAASAPPEVNGQNTSDPAPPADDLTVDDITPPVEDDKKEPMASPAKPKVPVPIKTTGARSAGPPTPLVKKILNSGTFGAGNAKATPVTKAASATGAATTSKPASATNVLKKSVSANTPASPTKISQITKAPSTGPSVTGPMRRASMAPAKPAAPTAPKTTPSSPNKPTLASSISRPLSSSTSGRPAAATAPKPAVLARSIVSPTSTASAKSAATATRPRASVSEGVKKAPAARQSLGGAMKPPAITPAPRAPASKPAATRVVRASISSMKEIQEDGGRVEALQTKLAEATESLTAKTEAIAALEIQIDGLKSSLETAQSDVQAKQVAVEQLEQAKTASEADLAALKATLEQLQADDASSALLAVQEQLESAKTSAINQAELVQNLQAQITTLEAETVAVKDNLAKLQVSYDSTTSDATAAAQVDHEALLKARADLEAIATATEALKTAHSSALHEATTKLREQEQKVASVEALETELSELKAQKEETSNKLSELEIEILELKESQDQAEDAHSHSLAKVKNLEDALATALAATQQAIDSAVEKDTEHTQRASDLNSTHQSALEAIREEQAKVSASLEALKEELAVAQAAHEQAKAGAVTASEDHTRQIGELEQLHSAKQEELSEQITKVTAELESQEAQYNAKVEVVKAEHAQLVEDAFERAQHTAGAAHGEELLALRAKSQASIEELRSAHQSNLEDLKKEHAALLESEVKSLEKRISTQRLELKATQDDLAKAKAGLEASRAEVANLTGQLQVAKVSASAEPDTAIAEEIERLTKALSHAHDDLSASRDALSLTKQSLEEVTNNQAKELEEAAKGRAEEVTRLKALHEQEVNTLIGQKTNLATKLSDLEGELATLSASSAAEASTSPKPNGNAAPTSPGITKEELQRMHEAHNAKLNDLQAEHEKALKAVKEELETHQSKGEDLQQEVGRKAMEIQYLEQEQEESTDTITRMKEDISNLTEQLAAKEA
ncbi:hypothetical protein FIBSPDRAFT_801088 [Athelia psychrophila]|uniref:Uncharacterized protein n=1 Tax=Athelia psychrophila TaxID=1759441 RepID=A0A165ZFH4_9AGAM|nr:hypothetical protein FIBSPDRAFT_801088 [Fibularhizoctonia sp. CBS 109695]